MTLAISIISLFISMYIFWLTRLNKGSLRMTKPSIICFLGKNENDNSKVFIRALLYSTSDLGQYVQNMFIQFSNGKIKKDFCIWAYGENQIVRGSGLFVNKNGVSTNHHFLLPKHENYNFVEGNYTISLYAETVDKKIKKIFEQNLSISYEQAIKLENGNALYYDWEPNNRKYFSYIEDKKIHL